MATLLAMGFGTSRLGIGATASDHLLRTIRCGASVPDCGSHAGRTGGLERSDLGQRWRSAEHGSRGAPGARPSLRRADEFMEIVLGCWDGWEDDALVVDKQSGLFAHPDKVHRMEYRGKYLTSRGTFTVPRSPQGHPVVIQAGSSDRGTRFSERWAETVFVGYPDFEEGKRRYAPSSKAWRGWGAIRTWSPSIPLRIRSSGDEGRGRRQEAVIERGYREVDGLFLLSEALNFDFAKRAWTRRLGTGSWKECRGCRRCAIG